MGPDFLTFNFLSTENEMKATRESPDTTYTILCFSRMGIGKYTTFRIVNICGQTHKIRPKRNKQEQRMVWQSVVAAWLSDGGGDVGCCCCYFVYMSIKMPPVVWVLVHGNESTDSKNTSVVSLLLQIYITHTQSSKDRKYTTNCCVFCMFCMAHNAHTAIRKKVVQNLASARCVFMGISGVFV